MTARRHTLYLELGGRIADKSSVQLNLEIGADVSFPGSHGSTHFGFDTQQVQIPADQQIVIGKQQWERRRFSGDPGKVVD
jgi:hypothetical protein